MERHREPLPAFMQMYALSGPIKEAADDDDASFFLYGQAAALSRDMAANDIVEMLVADTERVLAGLRSG